MKVYLAFQVYNYEGSSLLGAFDTYEKALERIQRDVNLDRHPLIINPDGRDDASEIREVEVE